MDIQLTREQVNEMIVRAVVDSKFGEYIRDKANASFLMLEIK